MLDFLYSLDKAIFYFCNRKLANPFFDAIMPPLTDWNQSSIGLAIAGIIILLLLWKGGINGKVVVSLLIPIIILSDQISSNVIKDLIARPRPCHVINGIPVLENIHLLVPCGAGYSFPSSHAANNFAFATLISFYFRRLSWLVFTYAGLMAFSRVSVGVHYPSDVLGGALFGGLCSISMIAVWENLFKKYFFQPQKNETADV